MSSSPCLIVYSRSFGLSSSLGFLHTVIHPSDPKYVTFSFIHRMMLSQISIFLSIMDFAKPSCSFLVLSLTKNFLLPTLLLYPCDLITHLTTSEFIFIVNLFSNSVVSFTALSFEFFFIFCMINFRILGVSLWGAPDFNASSKVPCNFYFFIIANTVERLFLTSFLIVIMLLPSLKWCMIKFLIEFDVIL